MASKTVKKVGESRIKVVNFNALYPVLCEAHNTCNRKAVDKKLCEEHGVDISHLNYWIEDVEALRVAVVEYVRLKHDPKQGKTLVTKARNKIFPLWKELLTYAEEKKDTRSLHVLEGDVDSLVGYAESFVRSGAGTQIAPETKQTFRKKVESLIGCRIAGNAVLTEEDRDTLKTYYSLESSVKKLEDALKEAVGQIEALKATLEKVTSEEFKEYLNTQITALEKERDSIKVNKTSAEKQLAEAKTKYDSVNIKLRYAECTPIKK